MYLKAIIVFAVIALTNLVGASQVNVYNHCAFAVFMWETFDKHSDTPIMLEPDGHHIFPFGSKADSSGPSIKISGNSTLQHEHMQVEYTVDDKLWYDLSHIDGDPFLGSGVLIHTSNDSCPKVWCAPGEHTCKDAYNTPKDDWATKSCDSTTELHVHICHGGPELF